MCLVEVRIRLGGELKRYREDAGLTQKQLAEVAGWHHHLIGKCERGERALSAKRWALIDEHVNAGGALVAAAEQVAQAADAQQRRRRELARQAAERTRLRAVRAPRVVSDSLLWLPDHVGALVTGQLEELLDVIERLARLVGRRAALELAAKASAGLAVTWLDPDEIIRIVLAVAKPDRVDSATVRHFRDTLLSCQKTEDTLGPKAVMHTVRAQLDSARELLLGGVPDTYRAPLLQYVADASAVLGTYYVDHTCYPLAEKCFRYSRMAAHHAGTPASGAYAAALLTYSNYLAGNRIEAHDSAHVTRGLVAQSSDSRLQAYAHQMAAAGAAINRDHYDCLKQPDLAIKLITQADEPTDRPWYWPSAGFFSSQLLNFLLALDRPHDARNLLESDFPRIDPQYVTRNAFACVRRVRVWIAVKEIDQAAQELANVVPVAHLAPRLAHDVTDARVLMDPWQQLPSVRELDSLLHHHGLQPA